MTEGERRETSEEERHRRMNEHDAAIDALWNEMEARRWALFGLIRDLPADTPEQCLTKDCVRLV